MKLFSQCAIYGQLGDDVRQCLFRTTALHQGHPNNFFLWVALVDMRCKKQKEMMLAWSASKSSNL